MMAEPSQRIEDLVEQSFEQLDALVRSKTAALRAAQKVLGPALAAIERKGRRDGLTSLGVTSFPIYLESRGLSPGEGFAMRSAAEACQQCPEVADAVTQRKLSVPKAALLNELLKKPELQRPDEDLVAAAQNLTTREFRNELNKRKAEARLPDRPVARTLFFSRAGVTALVRTRELVSSARKRSVSESEAAETALGEFVRRNDPEQKALRAMRRREARERQALRDSRAKERRGRGDPLECAPPPQDPSSGDDPVSPDGDLAVTRESPRTRNAPRGRRTSPTAGSSPPNAARSRYIPAEDRHRVIARFGDRCWVAGCDDRSRQTLAHGKPFRLGGSNRSHNLARYCLDHHRQFDGGQWRVKINGTDALLIDRRGLVVGKLRGLPPGKAREPRGPP